MAYTERRAAYGVILGENDLVAVVKGPSGHYWLPGGGSSAGESAEETLIREVGEELACGVRLIDRIGEATQFFYAADEHRHYWMLAVFFQAEFTEVLNQEGLHSRRIANLPSREHLLVTANLAHSRQRKLPEVVRQ